MIGLLGRKIGMTQLPDEKGNMTPVTILEVGPCTVIGVRTPERDGYAAIRVGYGEVPKRKLNRPLLGELRKALGEDRDTYPARVIREFRVDNPGDYQPGQVLTVEVFKEVERVDVTGYSKGRGFQGVMKRWGFSGGPMSHGSKFHRRPGSIGQSTFPGRVHKGKKMPGHMGMRRVTVKNLKVFKVIPEKNLLVVKGSVPGPNGRTLMVKAR